MANTFVTLPAPAGNGNGAGVDTSALGKERTITVQGTFRGSVIIEVSCDGGTSWGELCVFTGRGGKTYQVAANFMRVSRAGVPDISPGSPVVEVGSNDDGGLFTSLAAPAGNGTGAAVDVSTYGAFKTGIAVGGRGLTIIEISQDGGTTWQEAFSFTTGSVISKEIVAEFARVKRTGVPVENPGLPVVALGAIVDPGGGGGGGGGGLAFYGDGSDGDVTISANTTLARSMYYENLTIESGFSLFPDGYPIYVRGTLTIEAGAAIDANGNNASGATAGAGSASTRVLWNAGASMGGGNGAIGSPSNGTGSTESLGGSGGAGGASDNPGGTGGACSLAASRGGYRSAHVINLVRLAVGAAGALRGGGGGGGGAGWLGGGISGGGGGAGGAFLFLCARTIENLGTISADGGDGADGLGLNGAGGGGGGGGFVYVLYDSFTGNTPTASGGAGGTNGGGGVATDGTDGTDGTVVLLSNT